MHVLYKREIQKLSLQNVVIVLQNGKVAQAAVMMAKCVNVAIRHIFTRVIIEESRVALAMNS